MKVARLACSLLALLVIPVAAFAQTGETPLALGPKALASKDYEFRAYVTVEDDWDLFGVYRRGVGSGADFGVRAGYSDFAGGGFHIGGDIRYQMPWGQQSKLKYAIVGGLQFTFGDVANLFSVPFGVTLGTDVGNEERPVVLYGTPLLVVDRYSADGGGSDTELEFNLELGGDVNITRQWIFSGVLTIATNDNDNIELALGVIYRR
ncbi:MAG: hypothetical protein AMS21_04760 [Gemmatimonas sp. SG8_38_2]|nr:MAG: hypothetical protein AMS21_04760 [Gemmatimonas sp. SG8_38_2]